MSMADPTPPAITPGSTSPGEDQPGAAGMPGRRLLARSLAAYRRRWPGEAEYVNLFDSLLAEDGNPYVRERLAGHLTASAWLVDLSGQRVLLTHHRKLGMWLQLGGHADGDSDMVAVALREAEEESGLPGLSVVPDIFDIDRHWIPEHKGVPPHWHYDVRYVVWAGEDEAFVVSDESHALAWRDITGLHEDDAADPSLRRMAGKWLRAPGTAPGMPSGSEAD